ncbi:MAG: aromatic ring-hydroxylating dioxygenase subunit alpha [Halothece sp. Uz-M2-17]|nr:aromatic ring-hydroxylating dioxygenase subunit alpha [Halothece sp. Uz-M2-17]
MLKNFWYACEFSHSVTDQPLTLRLLNQNYVLYRTSQGKLVALKDQCAHRGAPLSMGIIQDECIQCPYHGWQYQPDGQCVYIPSNLESATIPKRVRVDRLPVTEKYDLVWVFIGDPNQAELTPIPDLLPEHEEGDTWRKITGVCHFQAHMTRVIEGFIDVAHVPYVHKQSFGGMGLPRVKNAEFETDNFSGRLVFTIDRDLNYRRIPFRPAPTKTTGTQEVTFHLPNLVRLKTAFEDFSIVIFAVCVPVQDNQTVLKWLHLRNFLKTPLADRNARKRVTKFLEEDRQVLDQLQPKHSPLEPRAEFHVSEDAMTIAFRNLLRHHYQ